MRVIVEYDERCYHSEREDVQYGSWSEGYNFEITSVRPARDDDPTPYGSEGYKLPEGSTEAHVLWMSYDTGDSFGRATGKGAILGVFAGRKVAEEALATVEKNSEEYQIEITDDYGRVIKMYNPGAGYFECINSLNVDTYSLANAPIRRRLR